MVDAAAIGDLLRSRGAEGLEHPGGTLYAHLERMQERLRRLGARAPVQLAGRAHAAYGTDGFDVALLDLAERPVLAGIIGEEAERLVYRYGACERASTWDAPPETGRVRYRFTGESEVLGADDLRDFAEPSIVNEVDVAEHSPEFLGRYGSYFRGLTAAWAPLLSSPVLAEARAVFG